MKKTTDKKPMKTVPKKMTGGAGGGTGRLEKSGMEVPKPKKK